MDNTTATASILATLRTVEFRLGLKGYNVDEVDEYLEKAAIESESLQDQLRTAQERLRQATERVGQLEVEVQRSAGTRAPAAEVPATRSPEVADDALQRTLLMAQKFVEQAKRESEAEAAETLRRAEERAQTMLGQAEERARQISTDAEQRLRDEVARLDALRTRLASEVDAMGRHIRTEREKIRSSLTEALEWFDQRMETGGDDGTDGATPPASAPTRPAPPALQTAGSGTAAAPSGSGQGNGAPEKPAGDRAPAATGARMGSLGSGELFTDPARTER